jgi:polyisoprenoid-binding protein YceI
MFRHRGTFCLSFAVCVAFIAASAPARAADNYQVDPIHSVIVFRIKHFDVGMFYGRFNTPQGTVTFDSQDPSKSSFQLQVKAQDFDSGNAKRDQHVRGPDFLNAKEFPTISFKSKSVKAADGDSRFEVTGDLTLHGRTKPVTAKLEKIGQAGNRIGFEGVLEIKKSDFGVVGIQGLSDEVRLIVAFEAVKAQ